MNDFDEIIDKLALINEETEEEVPTTAEMEQAANEKEDKGYNIFRFKRDMLKGRELRHVPAAYTISA